uniref:Response regulatory domain-containing protein n=1 Tax=Brassica campestris TaxID=3711 RepID=M4F0J4_BRACM
MTLKPHGGKLIISSDYDDKVVFFKDLSLGHHEAQLRFPLLHFWEAWNPVKKTLNGMEMLLIDEKLPSISKAMAEVTETVDQMRRNRWLPGRSDYYMCGKPGYMVRDCLEDTEAVVATVDGQEEVVATRWSQGPLYDKHLKLQRFLLMIINAMALLFIFGENKDMEEEINKRIMGGEALTVEDGNKSSWHLSVFTITADVIQATLEKFIKCEMDGYVSKPFAAEQLYRELSIFFNDFRYRIIRA